MSGYDDDQDDWFAEPEEPETEPIRQPPPAQPEDDWFRDTRSAGRAPRRPPLGVTSRRRVAAGVGAFVVLLLILWGAGAFNGGSPTTPPVTTPTQPPVTTGSTPATTTPIATPAPATTLAPGSTGAQVKRLQRALTALGYSTGKIDGSYGPATKAALARFQKASGLKADGILGPKTLQALKAKLAAR
jgi:hypothetical protein